MIRAPSVGVPLAWRCQVPPGSVQARTARARCAALWRSRVSVAVAVTLRHVSRNSPWWRSSATPEQLTLTIGRGDRGGRDLVHLRLGDPSGRERLGRRGERLEALAGLEDRDRLVDAGAGLAGHEVRRGLVAALLPDVRFVDTAREAGLDRRADRLHPRHLTQLTRRARARHEPRLDITRPLLQRDPQVAAAVLSMTPS